MSDRTTAPGKQPFGAPLAPGSHLRLMTSNVLAARWGEESGKDWLVRRTAPVPRRAEMYREVLAAYAPDAVGVQETDLRWGEHIPQMLQALYRETGMEYTWLHGSYADGKPNMTTLLYRSDKYTAEASDCRDFSYWNAGAREYHIRVLAWVKLRSKSDPHIAFVLVNTHWGFEKEGFDAASVQEEIDLVNRLRAEHGVPVFCTGDFNSRQDSQEVQMLLCGIGGRDTVVQARERGTLVNCNGGTGIIGDPRDTTDYIDHIFGVGDYEVLRYETILGGRAILLSDHLPQIADIKFSDPETQKNKF